MIKTVISLPKNYHKDGNYPLILLNDGEISYLHTLKEKAVIVGLISEKRTRDYTPWREKAVKAKHEDFEGGADLYHNFIFNSLLDNLLNEYSIDRKKIAYGGYSLGGLAAIYSLSNIDIPKFVFSLCGSFWYPEFAEFCKEMVIKNKDVSVYLQNGDKEGLNHRNILDGAVNFAKEVHASLKDKISDITSVFDSYGHHDNLSLRYDNLALWLIKQLNFE